MINKLLFPFFLILFANQAFSQTYESPFVESVADKLCYITKVEYTKEHTIVSFEHLNNNGWIRLNEDIQIKTPDNKRYRYIKADGITIAPEMYHFKPGEEKHAFQVYFEPLPKRAKVFDILEVEPGTKFDFNFYGVNVKKKRTSEEQNPHFKTTIDVVANGSGDFNSEDVNLLLKNSINFLKQPAIVKEQAHFIKVFYDALIAEGFTKKQALKILTSGVRR